MRGFASCLAIIVSVGCLNSTRASESGRQRRRVPVIYCTDLFHPPDDPDDYFDLATLYAMDELDLRLIVLDQGDKQLQRPGAIPVWQLNRLTGRSVPAVIGLGRRLKSPIDPALDQPGEFQNGVAMILRTLRDSPDPVMIATVGSVRDVVAAFNRDPVLFHRKVGKLVAFLGEASHPTFREYNVDLDPMAYVGLMRSRLPLYWVPCFDGGPWKNEGHASYWQASQGDLLANASAEVLQYFIYALGKEPGDQASFLSTPVDQDKKKQLFAGTRNLWGAVLLGTLSGRRVVLEGGSYLSVTKESPEAKRHPVSEDLYGFSAVDLSITDDAVVQYGTAPNSHRMMRFEVRNPAKYAQGLTAATSALLAELQISTPYGLCNYPNVSISNGMVDATIVLPDRVSGYYRGSRFDWSGMVAQIVYHGHTYTREWLVPHDPTRSDNAIGLAEEFGTGTAGMPGPPGYEEAQPGETFMKIGVGLLERVDESHYRFGYDYRILQPGTWQTRTGKRWVEFSQEMKQERGWGYRYTKRVELSPSRPELRITHTLTNLGSKTINQNHYCHNFLSIDGKPIGPGYRLTFPFKVALERDPGPLAEVQGRSILFRETPLEGHAAFSALTGFSTAARDNAVTVENTKSGTEVRIEGTQAPCRFQVFATHRVVCPEPFILITLLPGQTTSWMTRYTFSERKPHSDKS